MQRHPERLAAHPADAGWSFRPRPAPGTRWSRSGDPARKAGLWRRANPVPAAAARRLAPATTRPSQPPPGGHGWALGSVLLVDEDDFGRETLGRILEVDGYRVLPAANEEEARAHLHACPRPGLILLDLLGPRLEGWEFVREQGADLPAIPVIVVSTARPSDTACGFEGIVAHFEKPVTVCELLAAVHRHLPL
jgi:CheY-like chemotaxis protein